MKKAAGIIVLAALCCSACAATPTASQKPPSTSVPLSVAPAVQAAAYNATQSYRSAMAVAGFTLSNQLTTLANDSANNPAQMASDMTQLQQTYDIVRAQVSGTSSGSLGAAAATVDQLGGVVIDPRNLSALPSQSGALSAEAPEIAVILGRIVLSPQQIALTAKQSIEWIALHAPTADGTNAAVHHSDLVITAEACGKWLASLNALGVMVAPSVMHESVASMASLLSLLHQSGPASVRSIVEQADVTVASLAALAGDFSGYGSGGAYQ